MAEFWSKYSEKFLALSQREKLLISLGGAVGLFFILLTLLVEPAMDIGSSMQRQIKSESNQIAQVRSQIQLIKERLKKDPDREVDAQLKRLHAKSEKLSASLSEELSSLLSPNQMAELLEGVLDNSKSLKLISLESLPAEPVIKGEKDTTDYYIHPVRIELTGKYFDIKNYLSVLEEMPMKYFWKSFNYQVEEYPQARLILEVYTLGTGQEFIGG
ncbi:type II secretion system protein GspM [Vibrio sp. JC009]|uniref:type 4a pilus biogenesis protein PilO n=1 Tax=Vibrio sp. JC009 TaxID=2912314 RepID=UPI0023AECBE9|nr:type 4a pilus biogenesis protein PilO [Vibrio sp. JC009]WED21550.1 type II secretion system protein GspM [Vibrio sp. JC009]